VRQLGGKTKQKKLTTTLPGAKLNFFLSSCGKNVLESNRQI
jgi:hypothetical protein